MKEKCKLTVEWEIKAEKKLEEYMRKSLEATLAYEEVEFSCTLEALIVDEQTIKEMNNEYRQIDRVTDVLSFPLYESIEEARNDALSQRPILLGNMVICLQRAKEQAEEFGHSLEREICFLTVHSTLHLLGYDHEQGECEESLMFQKQRSILSEMGVSR